MQASSAYTSNSDPYRAGIELGTALKATAPEVIWLFCTIHYGGSTELMEGLYDGLGSDTAVLIGNSGDGVYATDRASNLGVAALGLNSGGKVRWAAGLAEGATADPEGATRRALAAVQAALGGEQPDLLFLSSDFSTDASLIERALHDIDAPAIGGFAADDNLMQSCFLFVGRKLVRDAIVMLGVKGDFGFDIRIGNSLTPIGQPGLVDDAEGTQVRSIDGLSAMAFIERETGKPVLQSDRGIMSLTVIDPARLAQRRLRSIVPDFSTNAGHLGLYGGIETGKQVQVCLARPDELIREVYDIAEASRRVDFTPCAALIVSCSGRKQLLGNQIEHEVKALSQAFPHGLPMAGFPSFGEIGPLRDEHGYTRNLFHNMTYVLLLIGDRGAAAA